jgi:poly-gamma-glutamate capsule biosynthesis protein CapA/YwtB (metallophosphatase superfamily)
MSDDYDRRRAYSGLLQRPGETRSYARKRRRRRRAWTAAAVLAIVAGVAAVAGMSSGMIDLFTAPSEDLLPTRAATETTEATGSESTPLAVESTATAEAARAAALASTEIEIGWVGDTTPGSTYGNPPNEGRALFEYTRDHTLVPDIMVANLEGTFGTGGPSKCDGRESSACYAFQAPPENASSLAWAGFDVVNMANNHSNDYFAAGLQATRDALTTNQIDYTGLNDTMAVKEVDGVKVAFLGFSPYAWSPNIGDIPAAQQLVRDAGEQADVVVVLMHAGAEGSDKTHTPKGAETAYGEFRGDSRAFSHAVIDAGADLVLGSGPHVVRGMEQYQGRLVAYSLGNFAGWKNFSRAGNLALSGLLTVRVAGDGRVLGGKWLSLRIVDPGVPKVDGSNASLSLVQRLSNEDFDTPVIIATDGTFAIEQQ